MNSLVDRDRQSIGAVQKLRFLPLAVTGGNGVHLRDEAGRQLLDLSAAWGAASLGYGHPRFVEAIAEAAGNPAGASNLSAIAGPAIELAEALLATLPNHQGHKVVFGHSGSDALETTLRCVSAATGRSRFLSFAGAYHGGNTASMSISGHPVQSHAARHPGLTSIPYPAEHGGAARLEELFATAMAPHEVAALFIEPIQSDGGMRVPATGELRAMAELCRKHGILTVCDEVKVGLGRTGKLHCFEHEGFTPDIVCFGKGLGGGLPLAAVIAPPAVLDHATAFAMQTLHGNPISSAAGLTVLNTIAEENLTANAADIGAYFLKCLGELKRVHPLIVDVRGRGLAIGVELDGNMHRAAAQVIYRAFELGVVVYYVGVNSNVLELTPPLIFSRADVDEAIAILDRALADVEKGKFDVAKLDAYAGW
jgi:4-aminobutyrate aminotransferase